MTTEVYPSYEELLESKQDVGPSYDLCRLVWYLKGSVDESIYVLRDATNPKSLRELYQQGSETHSISSSSLTEPPISSVMVSTNTLHYYESDWYDMHERAHHPYEEGAIWVNDKLIRCSCGQYRPLPGPTLLVKAEPGRYLTIGRYIDVVHTWLISLEGHIRAAIGIWDDIPLPSKYNMCLNGPGVSYLLINDERGRNSKWEDADRKRKAEFAKKIQQGSFTRDLGTSRVRL